MSINFSNIYFNFMYEHARTYDFSLGQFNTGSSKFDKYTIFQNFFQGGILLGPSAFGRNQEYMHIIFPKWSTPILESVASIGLVFFLFLVGLELDLSSIRRSGRRAFVIAFAGISFTSVLAVSVSFVIRGAVAGADRVGYPQYIVFMGVALSITAFPVLARILAELKLLTTSVGETAMAAAAINDVVAWISLALAVALAGNLYFWSLINSKCLLMILLHVFSEVNWKGTNFYVLVKLCL